MVTQPHVDLELWKEITGSPGRQRVAADLLEHTRAFRGAWHYVVKREAHRGRGGHGA